VIGGLAEGQTPLEPDEVKGLLIQIKTREALNQAEGLRRRTSCGRGSGRPAARWCEEGCSPSP